MTKIAIKRPVTKIAVKGPGIVQGIRITSGPGGPSGRGIVSVVRTSGTGAAGTTDTYTITYSDATTSTFQVYNGANGAGDVNGPASSTDLRIAVFSGTSGKLLAVGGNTIGGVLSRSNHTGTQSVSTITGLGGAATLNVGTTAGTVAAGDDSRITGAAPIASPTFTGDPKAPTPAASDDDTSIATTAHVKDAIQGGSVIALGTTGGSISLSSSLTAATAVNATVTITLNANTTFTAATMPTVAAGTQFTLNVTQDGTGSRTLTLTNILKPGGSLVLSTAAGAKDQIVFFYDGTNWWAALTGKAWAA